MAIWAGRNLWISAHFFYQGELDRLIVKLVGPLVAEIGDADPTIDFFFVRYWEGGPHVRLRIRTKRLTGHRNLVERRASEFFRAFPSEDRLKDPNLFSEFSAALAKREGVRAHPVRYPNDSVQFINYNFDFSRYGTAEGPVERHFGESSRIALGLLTAGLSMDQRQAVAFAAVLLTFAACDGLPNNIEKRIISNWSAWAFEKENALVLERAFSDAYEERKAELTALTLVTLNLVRNASARSNNPFASAWLDSLTNLKGSLNGVSGSREATLDACAHMLMNRLGLSPSREAYVRYLAARGAADVRLDDDAAGKSEKP
jgi:hypothetical protein